VPWRVGWVCLRSVTELEAMKELSSIG
jgi:hypothetical protein